MCEKLTARKLYENIEITTLKKLQNYFNLYLNFKTWLKTNFICKNS